jgi:peptidyl-prolyl cis-trans isomerase B (cyclophilin B)
MIQGGGYNQFGDHIEAPSIKGEFDSNGVPNSLKHTRGVLSMARTMFPNSASSQFFIMHQDAPHLDGQYAAFGKLVEGFDVLDRIATTPTGYQDRPIKEQAIKNITIE